MGAMEREALTPRLDWRRRAEELGFAFHTIDGAPYWDETACYRFSAADVDTIEDAANALEEMCMTLVDRVVGEGIYDRLRIPETGWPLIEASWKAGEKNLVGRFDLRYDGRGPPKLLEYNADTPTSLFEASVVQWEWLQTVRPEADQFNAMHERLIEAWPRMDTRGPVHFTCVRDHAEDLGTTEYLRDTAIQAGLETAFLHVDEIGWNGIGFVDVDDRPITTLFKLYPWEWLVAESFGAHIGPSRARVIEPAWKMVLSNKAALVLLWEMFPDHPNLLPAAFEAERIRGPKVRKPVFGREGANVEVIDAAGVVPAPTDGPYGAEGFVYQSYMALPETAGGHPVIGAWMIASRAAGMGIREDSGPITRDTSRFVPHYFV